MSARLTGTDTLQDAVVTMSEGNPGALRVLLDLFTRAPAIDPQALGGSGWGPILLLDTFGIYGSDIWLLYKDICGEDITRTLGVIRAAQLGIIASGDLVTAVQLAGGLDSGHREFVDSLDGVLKRVREQLPDFAKEDTSDGTATDRDSG